MLSRTLFLSSIGLLAAACSSPAPATSTAYPPASATARGSHATARSPGQSSSLEKSVADLATRLVDGKWIPGVVVGVIRGTEEHIAGFGATGLGGVPDRDTVFEIGSVSKVFTGELFAEAIERELVQPHDPVGGHLPGDVAMPRGTTSDITLEQLATHRSGLPRMPDNFAPKNPDNPYADYTVDQMYEFLSAHQLSRDPGKNYEYSNLGMGLLGHVVGLVGSAPYEQLLRDWITDPLGMGDTSITLEGTMTSRFATGHDEFGAVSAWDIRTLEGAGAIRSTAADMLRFVRAHLEAPTPAMQRATAVVATRPGGTMGLGWHIGFDEMTDVRWHNGQTAGFHSFIAYDSKAGIAVVVLANSSSEVVDQLGGALVSVLTERPYELELPALVPVDADVLARYAGTYEVSPDFVVAVSAADGVLVLQATGQTRFVAYPESDTRFNVRVTEAAIEFQVADGTVTGMTIFQGGQEITAAKTE
jgi:CubicO group peptidase (beta-lactamase class C family)